MKEEAQRRTCSDSWQRRPTARTTSSDALHESAPEVTEEWTNVPGRRRLLRAARQLKWQTFNYSTVTLHGLLLLPLLYLQGELQRFQAALEDNKSITSLHMSIDDTDSLCILRRADATAFFSCLSHIGRSVGALPHLESIKLSLFRRFHFPAAACVFANTRQISQLVIQQVQPISTLEEELCSESMILTLERHPCLESIECSDWPTTSTATRCLLRTLHTCEKLNSIVIRRTGVDNEHGDQTILHLSFLSPIFRMRALHTLSLENFCLSAPALDALVAALRNDIPLHVLELKNCSLPLEREALAEAFGGALATNTHLRSLTLGGVHLTGVFYNGLRRSLATNGSLESLDLENTNVDEADMAGFERALGSLSLNTGLIELVLPMTEWNAALAGTVKRSVAAHSKLQSLTIHGAGSSLDDSILSLMVDFILRSSSLENLVIWVAKEVQAGEGFGRLVDALLSSKLISVELWGWKVDDDAGRRVVEMARNNYCLNSLRVGMNDRDTRDLLRSYLALNQAGRSYLVTNPGNRSLGVDVLASVTSDLNCLYLHLRENPLLCKRDI